MTAAAAHAAELLKALRTEASRPALADATGLAVDTVAGWLAEWERLGIVEVRRSPTGKVRPKTYRLAAAWMGTAR